MYEALEITDRCIDCDNCRNLCPEGSIMRIQGQYTLDSWSCTLCGICIESCPVDCIKLKEVNLSLI